MCLFLDGVLLFDPEYLKERNVYVHVLAAFRYGREDLDVLGLTFRKDLYIATLQVYPPAITEDGIKCSGNVLKGRLTSLQDRLMKKLGENAYPFSFEVIGGGDGGGWKRAYQFSFEVIGGGACLSGII